MLFLKINLTFSKLFFFVHTFAKKPCSLLNKTKMYVLFKKVNTTHFFEGFTLEKFVYLWTLLHKMVHHNYACSNVCSLILLRISRKLSCFGIQMRLPKIKNVWTFKLITQPSVYSLQAGWVFANNVAACSRAETFTGQRDSFHLRQGATHSLAVSI